MTATAKKEVVDTALPYSQRYTQTLSNQLMAQGLIFFRISFYFIMLWEAWRFIENDWVERYYSNQIFYFKYWPFEIRSSVAWCGDDSTYNLVGIIAIALIFGFFTAL